jgi:hypothetical protein
VLKQEATLERIDLRLYYRDGDYDLGVDVRYVY